MKVRGNLKKMLQTRQRRLQIITGVLRATRVLRRGDCSALGVWELDFITGLVSDGDWAPNDQIGRLDG